MNIVSTATKTIDQVGGSGTVVTVGGLALEAARAIWYELSLDETLPIKSDEPADSDAAPSSRSVPAETARPPLKLFEPERTIKPELLAASPPLPEILPERIKLPLPLVKLLVESLSTRFVWMVWAAVLALVISPASWIALPEMA